MRTQLLHGERASEGNAMKSELVQLSLDSGFQEYIMLQDIDNNEYGFINEVKDMTFDEYKRWLKQQDDYSKERNLPYNWIPQTIYFLYICNKPVGIGRVRHYSSEYLEQKGVGNLGYGIAKSFRGKGYGNILFERLLDKCKSFGYSEITLYPYIDNHATNKVMLKYGAKLIGTFNNEKNIYKIPVK
jgi:predicted acetyltransferase